MLALKSEMHIESMKRRYLNHHGHCFVQRNSEIQIKSVQKALVNQSSDGSEVEALAGGGSVCSQCWRNVTTNRTIWIPKVHAAFVIS